MARPEWKPTKEELKAIYEMAKNGYTDDMIAKELDISRPTFYKHKFTFFEQLKKGRDEGTPVIIDMVVSALIKKCIGFEYEEVTEECHWVKQDGYLAIDKDKELHVTKRVKKFVVPSDQAIFYYLGNRAADKWKSVNYQKIEHELGENAADRFKEIADKIEKSDSGTD